MGNNYDVGVVGCWYWGNYGSLLNGYATFSILRSFGLKPLNIISPYNGFEPHAKKFFEAVYEKDDISELLPFERLHELNSMCGSFLTGSDQIWHYRTKTNITYDKYFRLDFAEDSKRKVSFATSFGKYQKEPDDVYNVFRSLYERYNAISVREAEGVEIFRNRYSIYAERIMEPVLDVPVELWKGLAEKSAYKEQEPYLLTYILDPTEEKRKAIQYYSMKSKLKAVNILDGFSGVYAKNKEKLNLPNTLPNIWCADLMKYYSEASFVITDSFHGVCFAIAFNKPFIAIANYGRGIKRFETMLTVMGLKDRLVYDSHNIPHDENMLKEIDFTECNSVIESERKRSVDWLRNAMTAPVETLPSIKISNNVEKSVVAKLNPDSCIGCGACVSVCPTGALSLGQDKHGYYISVLDNDKCINCGMCSRTCPGLELPVNNNKDVPEVYEFISEDDDLLYRSSSGGFFTQAARQILGKKGVVVGAAWKDDFTVEHIIVDNEKDLEKLRKSKYLQSYTGDIDKRVKELLDQGRHVLFTGTPCQVAGLRKYLNKDYDNLIVIDVLCANAPSSMFFKKYVEERFGDRIKSYQFRDKSNGYNCLCVRVGYKDGTSETFFGGKDDNYQRVFHNRVMMATHCEKCRYQSLKRHGDLTIGDFWGLEKRDKKVDHSKGVTLLCVNNEKGKIFLESIPKDIIRVLKNVPVEWTGGNGQTKAGVVNVAHPKRDAFYKAILTMPFSKAVDFAMKPNHGVYPLADKKIILHCVSPGLPFSFDRNTWEQHIINDKTVLTTRPVNPPIGKYAVIALNDHLVRNKTYIIKLKYMIRTKDSYFNFHVKDSGSNIFQVIHTYKKIADNIGTWIEKEIEFSPNADFYDEFMLGAAQLKGEDAYIAFDYITIIEK